MAADTLRALQRGTLIRCWWSATSDRLERTRPDGFGSRADPPNPTPPGLNAALSHGAALLRASAVRRSCWPVSAICPRCGPTRCDGFSRPRSHILVPSWPTHPESAPPCSSPAAPTLYPLFGDGSAEAHARLRRPPAGRAGTHVGRRCPHRRRHRERSCCRPPDRAGSRHPGDPRAIRLAAPFELGAQPLDTPVSLGAISSSSRSAWWSVFLGRGLLGRGSSLAAVFFGGRGLLRGGPLRGRGPWWRRSWRCVLLRRARSSWRSPSPARSWRSTSPGGPWSSSPALLGSSVDLVAAAVVEVAAFLAVAFGTFLAPETYAFSSEPARNRGTAVALARLRSPVRGLRTIRAARGTFSNTPKPVIETFWPPAVEYVIVCTTAFSAASRLCLVAVVVGRQRLDQFRLVHGFPSPSFRRAHGGPRAAVPYACDAHARETEPGRQ